MRVSSAILSVIAAASLSGTAMAAPKADTGEPAFRALYKELVETNTTLSVGSCTLAAERLAVHLRAAGYTDADMHIFAASDHPKEGGLVVALKGSDTHSKGVLLLAHLDVVEAKREDWTRDPFTMIEEGGYFYARGVADDKAMAAIFTDLMIRLKSEKYQPKRDIKLALTCGEETSSAFNGAAWLLANHKDWIDADFALNEGAGGELDEKGNRIVMGIQSGEKVNQNFVLETTNPGGHSSQPTPDNALYHMAGALTRLAAYDFPAQLNDTTRAYFSGLSKLRGGPLGAAMAAIVKDPTDAAADKLISQDKGWHSMLRTTCVATTIQGGHAVNALPQRVRVNVNCRIFPGVSVDSVKDTLIKVINDPAVSLSLEQPLSPTPAPPPLSANVLKPLTLVSSQMYPGVPILPTMSTGYTDARHLNGGGIPTYGVEGFFGDPDGGGMHGLNERIRVQSVMEGREFHYRLIKAYTH
jgi:acetylornithine deacetylase/succinyl-diaminopimelate desuccinylase-like protein